MLFCAPKLVWDLLSRPSAQTVHPFICLSVYPSVRPLPRPPFVSLFLRLSAHPFIPRFFHPSVFPSLSSVRPYARPPSFHSFVSLSVCPFVCQSIRFPVCLSFHSYIRVSASPSINEFVYLSVCSVRPSVCLSVFPTTYAFVLSFVSPSIRLTIYLFTMAPDK